IDPRIRASFMAASLAIAVPSAVKTFNWITTMWNGRLRLTTPMLFSIGFVANFIIGGVTGVFLAAIPIDLILHDTYYVVGHFHYVIMGAIGFAVFAGVYYWYPIVTGKMYGRTLGKWHFWLSMIGTNLTFFAMLLLGYGGMPRRYATYDAISVGPLQYFTDLHQLATLGALILLIGQIIWLWNMVQSYLESPLLEDDDPWNLGRDDLRTREWNWLGSKQEDRLVATDGGEDEAELVADGGGENPLDASGADRDRDPTGDETAD
ncbi:MAG: cbb3-type cytochrome c oxidase subunit I, partial [Halanaeroarchaeum sp.]